MENKTEETRKPGEDKEQGKSFSKKGKFKPRDRRNGNRMCIEKGAPNDWKWYAQSEQLLRDAASLAYSNPQGRPLSGGGTTLGSYPIHVVKLMSTIGTAEQGYDTPTVAARQLYSFVRHANSGSTNYEAPDLFMYILAMGEIYSMFTWMVRLYGVLQFFNGKNRAVPTSLTAAMGVDYDDLITHLADLRYFINQLGKKINSFYVPKTLPYFLRKVFIYSQVYKDSESDKAEIFFFQPHAFLSFDGTSDPNGSMLKPSYVPFRMTFNDIVNYANGLVNPLMAEEDINIMSGDILKAFGKDNVFELNEVSEDYATIPVYSPEVLAQYHNADILLHDSIPTGSFNVTQTNAGVILQDRKVLLNAGTLANGITNAVFGNATLLDADDDPDAAYNMIATRLKLHGGTTIDSNGNEVFTITTCGTEVAVLSEVYSVGVGGNVPHLIPFGLESANTGYATNSLARSYYLSRMHYAPLEYVAISGITSYVIGEQNNFTLLEHSTLEKMHTTAVLSLFGVQNGAVALVSNYKR